MHGCPSVRHGIDGGSGGVGGGDGGGGDGGGGGGSDGGGDGVNGVAGGGNSGIGDVGGAVGESETHADMDSKRNEKLLHVMPPQQSPDVAHCTHSALQAASPGSSAGRQAVRPIWLVHASAPSQSLSLPQPMEKADPLVDDLQTEYPMALKQS